LFGEVEPYEDLVCFNEEGGVKIWINSNLAENRVERKRERGEIKKMERYNRIYVNKIY
jgi:RecB family endonuclease NucS